MTAAPMAEPLRRFNYRQLFWKWHLYAGWFGGPLLMLISLTGAILVFGPELDTAMRPDLWKITPPSATTSRPLVSDQAMLDLLRTKYPQESVVLYRQNQFPDQPYQFLMLGKSRSGIHDVWVNQYTGQIVGERLRETSLVRIAEQLHRRLLTGETGATIIEFITGWGIVLSITGVFLWWPKTLKTLQHGLTLSFQGSGYKINWRLHNTLGAWAAIFILLMSVTGMVYSTYSGELYRRLMDWTGASQNPFNKPAKSIPVQNGVPVSLDPLLEFVRANVPAGTPLSVRMPRGPDASFVISTLQELRPEWQNRTSIRFWTFDQFTGQQLETASWHDLHPLMKLKMVSLGIHYGSIFGLPTRIIALVVCLIVPILTVTGYLIWWWKRAKKSPTARERVSIAVSPRRTSRPISKWLVATLLIIAVIFPTIGISFLALTLWEFVRYLITRSGAKVAQQNVLQEASMP